MSSDDEPLINLVKKPLKAVKKTTTPAKKSVPGKTNKAVNRRSTSIVQSTSEGENTFSALVEAWISKQSLIHPRIH